MTPLSISVTDITGSPRNSSVSAETGGEDNNTTWPSRKSPPNVVAMPPTRPPVSPTVLTQNEALTNHCRLYISNLPYAAKDEDLRLFFIGYDIVSTSVPVNPRTNRPVGYGFVDLRSAVDAQRAVDAISGKLVMERKVSVQIARDPRYEGPERQVSEGWGANDKKRKRKRR